MQPDTSGNLPKRRTPKTFYDLDHHEVLFALHDGLRSLGPTVYAFTGNLSFESEPLVRDAPSAASAILENARRCLSRALQRPVDLWFSMEQKHGEHGRLHIHGEVAAEKHELERFREAMRRALDEWEAHRQFQVVTAPNPHPDDGWVFYCAKHAVCALKNGPVEVHKGGRGFSGLHYAATQPVRRAARDLYEAKRKAVIAGRGLETTSLAEDPTR